MKSSGKRLLCVGLAALGLGGCAGMMKKDPPAAAKPATPAGGVVAGPRPTKLQYLPANEGLPTSRIWKSQIAFGDINADGFPDIGVVSRLADGPWIFTGDGKGNWQAAANGLPREPFCGGGMDFADINKDGKMDVAIADHCKGVFVFVGDGTGNWKTASSGLPSIGAEDVALGDFDNDGCTDLVSVAASEEGVRAFRGNCKGVWREASEGLSLTEWGNSVVFADINADGNLDVAAAYSGGPRAWLGNGKGKWQEASEGLPAPDIHGLFWGIAVGDVNADGKLDIASGSQMPPQPSGCGGPGGSVCEGGGLEVFLQQPDGKWKSSNGGIHAMNVLGVTFGDLNKDGHLDLVAAGKTHLSEIGGVYGVFPYIGDGKGNWTLDTGTGLPATGRERTWGVGVADIDRDGMLDIGTAFGDVLAPSWRSATTPDAAKKAPDRGKFGSIQVWRGQLPN